MPRCCHRLLDAVLSQLVEGADALVACRLASSVPANTLPDASASMRLW